MSAIASGTMFVRWRRLDEGIRRKVWTLYGWFTGLSFIGSCFGVAAWLSWMKYLDLLFQLNAISNLPDVQFVSVMKAPSVEWLAAFLILCGALCRHYV